MPNPQQIQSIIRWLLAAGGPIAAILLSHGATQGDIDQIMALALYIVPPAVSLIWSMIAKTHANLAATAQSIPGVTVTADPMSASPKVFAAVSKGGA